MISGHSGRHPCKQLCGQFGLQEAICLEDAVELGKTCDTMARRARDSLRAVGQIPEGYCVDTVGGYAASTTDMMP